MKVFTASQIHAVLEWDSVIQAIHQAHLGARHNGDGFFLGDSQFGLLSRGVILPGKGAGLKLSSICPSNAKSMRPVEDALFIVVDEQTKAICALLDGPTITQWKTAGDSVTAAKILSRQESKTLLVLGAGPVAAALVDAYLHIRPNISHIMLWNRTAEKLQVTLDTLHDRGLNAEIVTDLNAAVEEADIIASATSSHTPLILGRYVQPGTHIDLLGGFRPEMQEADGEVMQRGRIFVDDRSNALQAGDLHIPLSLKLISPDKIEADLYELCQSIGFERQEQDITIYKNAGGAHLDLAVSLMALSRLEQH